MTGARLTGIWNVIRRIVITVLAAVLASSFGVVAASAAHAAPSGPYAVSAFGAVYGSGATQKVSIYRPMGAPGRRPAAYMIHGGAWMAGSRAVWNAEAYEWASRGWVVINADFTRAVSDGQPGDGRQMEADIITVVLTYEQLSYVNRDRQVMMGDSSGGHLATLVGAFLHGHVRAAIGWSPVAIPANAADDGDDPSASTAVQALGRKAREFWGYSSGTTSALRYEAAFGGPPMLLIGSVDDWVSWDHQGGALCAAIGSRCTKVLVAGALHGVQIRDTYPAIAEQARNYALHAIAL